MKKILYSFVTLALLVSASLFAEEAIKYQVFESDVQIVDVRSDAEWNDGHHPDALHVPHTTILEGKGFFELDKNKPVVVYCRSGGRAERAKDFLEAQGFTNVTNLGGISDLIVPKKGEE